ncbi:MAG: ParA family protein [Anaerolineales bacterium]|nr:ParA family protein [Anaerolineales bacterium]
MSYVIAICHQKGGVAKTTTTLGLGAAFVERGVETLVVDLDPQANLTFNIGLEPGNAPFSAAEILTGEAAPARAAVESSLPGMDIIPSNASMLDIGRRMYQMPNYEFLLRRALEDTAMAEYAVVLLDCPPSVGPLTINALTAADLLIIPTQCEYYSIQALPDMFELVNVIRDRTNPPLTYRLLVTMFDGRGKFHATMLEQLRGYFKDGLLHTTIGFDTKLREAQAAGSPITIHAPLSRGASQYRQLAEELSPYVSAKSHVQTA